MDVERWALERWRLMTNDSHLRVSNPPPKPLLIWDGECHFCRRWIERWQEITAGKVDYVTYQQSSGDDSRKFRVEQFERAVALIEPDGEAFFAARSRLSIVAISIFEKMAGVELRSRSGIRGDFGKRLQIHRATSQTRHRPSLDCCGATTFGRRLISGRDAGFFACSV